MGKIFTKEDIDGQHELNQRLVNLGLVALIAETVDDDEMTEDEKILWFQTYGMCHNGLTQVIRAHDDAAREAAPAAEPKIHRAR